MWNTFTVICTIHKMCNSPYWCQFTPLKDNSPSSSYNTRQAQPLHDRVALNTGSEIFYVLTKYLFYTCIWWRDKICNFSYRSFLSDNKKTLITAWKINVFFNVTVLMGHKFQSDESLSHTFMSVCLCFHIKMFKQIQVQLFSRICFFELTGGGDSSPVIPHIAFSFVPIIMTAIEIKLDLTYINIGFESILGVRGICEETDI